MRPMKVRRNRTAAPRAMDPKMLSLLLAAVALALVVLITAFSGRQRDTPPLGSLPISWKVRPVWPGGGGSNPSQDFPLVAKPQSLAVYLDVSEPLSGFLPFRPADPSPFRSVVVSLVPEQLARVAGSTSAPFDWVSIGAEKNLHQPQPPATLTRDDFPGSSSRLNEAVSDILKRFDQGQLRAAALITDLVATDGGPTGAMGIANALKDRMSSEGVRRGDLHVGLLGVRALYLGVKSKSCHPPGELGCWFSEQTQHYKPMTRPAKVPFYVLILGRSFDAVQAIGEGIREGGAQLGLETQWEVLTAVTKERPLGSAECTTYRAGRRREPQYTLVRQDDGKAHCAQEEDVEILCPLPNGVGFESPKVSVSWSGASAALEGKTAVVTLSCAALRALPPGGELTVRVDGSPVLDLTRWRPWSKESDDREEDLGRTLQLTSFLDTVWPRPEHLEVFSGTLLPGFDR